MSNFNIDEFDGSFSFSSSFEVYELIEIIIAFFRRQIFLVYILGEECLCVRKERAQEEWKRERRGEEDRDGSFLPSDE